MSRGAYWITSDAIWLEPIQVLDETEMEAIINKWVSSGCKGCLCQRLIEAVLQKKHRHQDNVTIMAVALEDLAAHKNALGQKAE